MSVATECTNDVSPGKCTSGAKNHRFLAFLVAVSRFTTMGSKPSTTKSVAKHTDKNADASHKTDTIEQKQQTEPEVTAELNLSEINETQAEETETITLPTTTRRVTMTSHISFTDKDDNGRKQINQ